MLDRGPPDQSHPGGSTPVVAPPSARKEGLQLKHNLCFFQLPKLERFQAKRLGVLALVGAQARIEVEGGAQTLGSVGTRTRTRTRTPTRNAVPIIAGVTMVEVVAAHLLVAHVEV